MPILMNISGPNGIIAGNEANGEWTVLSCQWGVTEPHDTTTGLSSGKRQHQPVTIVLEMAPNIQQLMGVLSHDVTLQTVAMYFSNGQGVVKVEMILTNVNLASLQMSSGGDLPTFTLTMYYTAIEFTGGGVVYRDTWEIPLT